MSTASAAADEQLNNLPYVPWVEYNNTESTGGDSLRNDLNIYYQSGDIAWMLTCTALVLLMVPGVG
jgi:Amt family ammonium transporter